MSERSAVQEPMLKYADEIGWQSVSQSEAMQMRGGDTTALYFVETLKTQLLKLNKGIVDDSNCTEIMRKLGLLNADTCGKSGSYFCGCVAKNQLSLQVRIASAMSP